MPIYEYKCLKCGNIFEVFQSINSEPLKKCEKCGGEVRRVLHAPGIIFKGPGFYTTEYRSKDYIEAEKKEREAERKSEDKKEEASSKQSESKTKEAKSS